MPLNFQQNGTNDFAYLWPVLLFVLTVTVLVGGRLCSDSARSLFCFRGASVSALHRDVNSYPALDLCSLVHPVETCFTDQFPHQFGMELDVFIQGII